MSFKKFFHLLESNSNTALISIDIQPSYLSACKHLMNDYVAFLNRHRGPIIVFWNGEDLGMESLEEMQMFLADWGVDETVLESIVWREKTYAFFRNWMDSGMDRRNLIKAIRYMVTTRRNDSRDITDEEWEKVFGDEWEDVSDIVSGDMINLPDISISELKRFSGCYLCGGGKDECLSEFRLLLESFNIPYKLVEHLVY